MKYVLPTTNRLDALAKLIKTAADGDTIVCHTQANVELASRAAARMCPNKSLKFCVGE